MEESDAEIDSQPDDDGDTNFGLHELQDETPCKKNATTFNLTAKDAFSGADAIPVPLTLTKQPLSVS